MSRIQWLHTLVFIPLLSVLSYGQVWFIHDLFWDDNCWVLSAYASANLHEFLGTAFVEMRREALGVFLYYLAGLHKSADSFYVIIHAMNLAIQILSPILLYFLTRNILIVEELLALFVALAFTVFPLDHELPHISGMNYRIGLMLAIASLWFTERALARQYFRWSMMLLALGCAVLSSYVFIEATISLEVGRLVLIGYVLSRQDLRRPALIKRTILYWLPFFLAIVPLALLKFLYRPYGMYQGAYETDALFFLDYQQVFKTLAHVVYFPWIVLLKDLHYASIWSVWSGALGMAIALVLLTKLMEVVPEVPGHVDRMRGSNLAKDGAVGDVRHMARPLIILGGAFVVPQPACICTPGSHWRAPGSARTHPCCK